MNTYQIFAHTPVWRVVEIVHTTEATVSTGEAWETRPRLMTGRVAYRWTRKGADRLRDRWARATSGGAFAPGFVVQGGVVHWVPDDEWNGAVEMTDWGREQNIDDRPEAGPGVTWTPARGTGQPVKS